jgi:hypothetical protein
MNNNHQEKRLKYNNQRSTNRPSNDDYQLLNIKLRPDHHLAFRIKSVRENKRMSDYLRDHIAELIQEELRPC